MAIWEKDKSPHAMQIIYPVADLSHYSSVSGRQPVFQTCSCFFKEKEREKSVSLHKERSHPFIKLLALVN